MRKSQFVVPSQSRAMRSPCQAVLRAPMPRDESKASWQISPQRPLGCVAQQTRREARSFLACRVANLPPLPRREQLRTVEHLLVVQSKYCRVESGALALLTIRFAAVEAATTERPDNDPRERLQIKYHRVRQTSTLSLLPLHGRTVTHPRGRRRDEMFGRRRLKKSSCSCLLQRVLCANWLLQSSLEHAPGPNSTQAEHLSTSLSIPSRVDLERFV